MILYDKTKTEPLFTFEIKLEYQKVVDKFLVIIFELDDTGDRLLRSIYDIIQIDSRNPTALRDVAALIWHRVDHGDVVHIQDEWEFGRARSPAGKIFKALQQALQGVNQ
ncbi:hypothetical protein EVB81_122 [Rhizobium phage RHph_I46]|uniref:Uncharacterized protein n=1 Tax=Rhizobium phage RHph_I1_9 TaxID=2509729 RepID=A0A7S5R9R1_9CAUD|nr:hypothetical protein PP936_gp121 [Rhizobium phage RHph_I1_9]QIG69691.1 hypothetical protein EVB81_122 [Rhizobium phage RHph_I46]QIG70972.1 hypothetical protein EVB92_122 [Rhizobium phage RHph_I9]QIG73558.1 hypothetical protein EVC04_121 [Rhizobium phage RHph_I1_9]QIG76311.1 hypothetical protein EVC25_122 [Rhizobium phage RHph_I34]